MSMRQAMWTLAGATLLALAGCSGYKTHKGDGFRLDLPKDWEVTAGQGEGEPALSAKPKDAPADGPWIQVRVEPVPSEADLTPRPDRIPPAYRAMMPTKVEPFDPAQVTTLLVRYTLETDLLWNLPDVKIVEQFDTVFNGHKCIWLAFTFGDSGKRLRRQMYFFVEGDKAYIVTGQCPEADFEKCREQLSTAGETFKLK